MALKHQQNAVALLYTERFEVIGGAAGILLHIGKGEPALGSVERNVQHSELIGLLGGYLVNDVKGEIEFLCILKGYGKRRTVLVLDAVYIPVVYTLVTVAGERLNRKFLLLRHQLGHGLAGRVKYNGIKQTVFSADRYHTVRR